MISILFKQLCSQQIFLVKLSFQNLSNTQPQSGGHQTSDMRLSEKIVNARAVINYPQRITHTKSLKELCANQMANNLT